MTKKIIIPNGKNLIETCISDIDGILIGIENLSVNMPFCIKIDEIEDYLDIVKEKQLFIALNKNMHNQDLEHLTHVLTRLQLYPIAGVFFYDISIMNLKEKLHLSYPLIWSQEHLTTNSETCNFWTSYGAKGAYLSSEITLEEIKEIRKNTSCMLFVNVFGHLPMFVSKRHLVKNYLKTFTLESKGTQYYAFKEGKKYPLIDDQNGTTMYSNYILNAISEITQLSKIGIDYVILNSFQIEDSIFKEILQLSNQITEQNGKIIEEQIENLCNGKTDKGFLYKETIYKVKGGN